MQNFHSQLILKLNLFGDNLSGKTSLLVRLCDNKMLDRNNIPNV